MLTLTFTTDWLTYPGVFLQFLIKFDAVETSVLYFAYTDDAFGESFVWALCEVFLAKIKSDDKRHSSC